VRTVRCFEDNSVFKALITPAGIALDVKALGSNPRKSSKNGSGKQDIDITIGGATFRPGVRVYCDRDGILVER
jgi:regulator of ribonuclease activity A